MIKVRNLKKKYSGKVLTKALDGISFEIQTGEFVAIMGRSGSGKSTLLHQIGLLDTPSGGEIFIDGNNISEFSESQRDLFRLKHLGYVFQEYALIAELTALENVCLPALVLDADHDYKKHAMDVLKMMKLENRLDHYPNELSGGEQQRVAIARSLINNPKILFADEPTANLDSVSSRIVLELFQKLNKEHGQTIIMVTHEPEDRKYVDKVIWLKDGLLDKVEQNHLNSKDNKYVTRHT